MLHELPTIPGREIAGYAAKFGVTSIYIVGAEDGAPPLLVDAGAIPANSLAGSRSYGVHGAKHGRCIGFVGRWFAMFARATAESSISILRR
jgi:hypothetical protein